MNDMFLMVTWMSLQSDYTDLHFGYYYISCMLKFIQTKE